MNRGMLRRRFSTCRASLNETLGTHLISISRLLFTLAAKGDERVGRAAAWNDKVSMMGESNRDMAQQRSAVQAVRADGGKRLTPRAGRVVMIVAAALAALCAIYAGWRCLPGIYAWLMDAEAVRAHVAEHALLSRVALVGINVAQVLLAFLPGEPAELASGYAFGFVEGTVLCLVASAIGTTIIYGAVNRWGRRVVELFFAQDMLERYAWLRDARKLELVMLVAFLIPGTPKDFLTYFAGLTAMRFPAVLLIATLGRLPSIVTSTIAASAFGDGNYLGAAAAMVAAALLLAAGTVAYRVLERRSASSRAR